ncbi:MAG: DNA primase [Synergistes jonesii]|uniref:DNA primase n=1 Tax=Synergistes jonesii TaxID=2754 RepID=UPI002A74829C|nr:DNA primase [Synergistes jonesii]MDY2984110.1 DNA primase [Synergistes jonesii]
MPDDDVREIKSRLDIVDVVSEYVKLKRNGRTFWGCCPFHNEKTPSFSVSPERQTFHCFGCGKGGDIFTFIMEAEHLEFREALERLAERAGVALSQRGKGRSPKGDKEINRAALDFFIESLNGAGGEPARKYLKKRSIAPEDCHRFELGWAPNSWDMLSRRLEKAGYGASVLVDNGLASVGKSGGCYDRFRGRLMFPIYNVTGRLVGFGGRILDGEGAKYLNSPESRLFNKRHNLYLLDKAKGPMSSMGHAILVEGYFDAIRAHLCGYTNAVASLGTSLTQEQAALIKRMTGLCYVCYDSDSAGQEASLRAMYVLQGEGVAARRVVWQQGKDPDELLLQPDGGELFEKALKSALPLPLFHAQLRKRDMDDPLKAEAARRDLLDGLASLSVFDLTPYLGELAEILGIFPHEVQNLVAGRRTKKGDGRGGGAAGRGSFYAFGAARGAENDIECMMCSMLWNNKKLRSAFSMEELMSFMDDPDVQNVVYALLGGDDIDAIERRWQQTGETRGMEIVARGNGLLAREGMNEETAAELAEALRQRYLKKRKDLLLDKIRNGTINEKEYEEYYKYIRSLKGGNTRA